MKGLIDSTLREGGQTVGVSFSAGQKKKIITRLNQVGIEEIELGVASLRNSYLPGLMQEARQLVNGCRLSLWCRCLAADIDFAASLKPDVLSLSIPASDLHLKKKMMRDRSWAQETLNTAVRRAHSAHIPYISVGLEDATRADNTFLLQLARIAEKAGAQRIRLADTVGLVGPVTMKRLVELMRQSCGLEIGVHTHNDFGMATANAITALEAGADWADVTVLGLGERAGNAKLEEVAGYLSLNSKKKQYNVRYLKNLCQEVAGYAERQLSPGHPVVGEAIFSCESSLHLQGLVRETSTYEPYSPEAVGGKRNLLYGENTGRRAVADCLANLNITPEADSLDEAVTAVRRMAGLMGRPLNAAELMALL